MSLSYPSLLQGTFSFLLLLRESKLTSERRAEQPHHDGAGTTLPNAGEGAPGAKNIYLCIFLQYVLNRFYRHHKERNFLPLPELRESDFKQQTVGGLQLR